MEPEITERHAMTVESGTLTGKIQRIPLSGPILHELNPHENAVDGRVGPNIDRGWAWIVAGSAVCAFATSSGLLFTFSMYYICLLDEFGESRSQTAWIGSIQNGVYMLAGPISTLSISKMGIRPTIMISGLITCAGYVLSSLAPDVNTLFITFGCVAAFGCCLNYTGWVVAISSYFHQKHSLAFSIAMSGFGIGILAFGNLYQWLIDNLGWRGAFLISGGVALHFTLFGSLVFPLKNRSKSSSSASLSTRQILTDFRVWMLNVSCFFWLLSTLIVYLLLADFAQSIDLQEYYIYTLSAMGVGDLIGRLSTGFLMDYFRIQAITFYAAAQLTCAVSILSLLLVSSGIQLIIQSWIFSIVFGFHCVLMPLVPRQIYGSENLNDVFGIILFSGGVGSLIGSPLAGYLVDVTQSYQMVFIVAASAELAAAVASLACWYRLKYIQ